MKNIWDELNKPIFVLAPMDDVTDTVFRRIVAGLAPPDLYFTEFVNVDGLQSVGREKLIHKLQIGPNEGISRVSHLDEVQENEEKQTSRTNSTVRASRTKLPQQSAKSSSKILGSAENKTDAVRKSVPIIAQIWGKHPENYYKTTKDLIKMGFDGVDINMGCPVKAVVKDGCCVALVDNRILAGEIIKATQKAAKGKIPVSVKTRIGNKTVDMTWIEFLLKHNLDALTVHGRTAKQMSKVPADWDKIGQARELRDQLSPTTRIIGNGDVMTRQQGVELAKKYKLDGIMIGRGIFHDPFVFANSLSSESPWPDYSKAQKIELYKKHVQLFKETWKKNERRSIGLNKFCKIYINGFDGAKELRVELMSAKNTDELLQMLS